MLIPLTAATTEPVTLAEAKAHLRMIHTADDALITRQIRAAREHVELTTGVALAAATWRMTEYSFQNPFVIPFAPVATVSAVSYMDASGARVVIAPAEYRFDPDRVSVAPVASWPSWATAVNVDFTTAPGLVPEALKSAILLRVQAEYESEPDDADKLRMASHYIAWPFRRNLGV